MTFLPVWAPAAQQMRVVIDDDIHEMHPTGGGWWESSISVAAGARYGYLIDDSADPRPDPRSPRQPDGVHGLSQVHDIDPEIWSDSAWTGKPIAGAIIYELHVGTFTPAGTLDGAIDRLDHLVGLGVDFVELMPVNAFNGTHNWGYDGVGWYAVQETYGGPDALARFVNACHLRGLGVIIDAVYNHLGPSGNYLPEFGPYLTTGATSWGQSVNLDEADSDEVRKYILGSALRWLEVFHVDGLRLDAVHALVDRTALHLLEELQIRTDELSRRVGRPLSLIAESDLNDPKLITARSEGGYGLAAQWSDDGHHAIHTTISGERQGYYADFGSLECLSKVLREGFFHALTYSSFRRRRHGRPIDPQHVTTTSLVVYTCNHDQIGNRAVGDRPSAYLTPGQLAAKAALVLTSPFTPMLFMGEEWAATSPFQFFTSHPEPELGEATANGRKAEFAEHGWDAAEIPDPQDPETFERSKLRWAEIEEAGHARVLDFYRALITLRKEVPELSDDDFASVAIDFDADNTWFAMHRGALTTIVTLTETSVATPFSGEVLVAWEPPSDDGILSGHNAVVLRRT
ncbi:maltooligosyl trehalose hydrolase [Williamsia limnetica]|uniref:Malto-oligosyltrehalose trehalohydrolase n=1 Tax=Williamsia limnetica TaxID=882452 RepID=A0A318RK55_WILLI|nr:malto-oligosyltrehalose trehalohydrolase [Williamsia limnetica]PYE15823.1 maltooligosyl trehalose hydrolase [Williamsia limnetica]